jgi:hypothetical protein
MGSVTGRKSFTCAVSQRLASKTLIKIEKTNRRVIELTSSRVFTVGVQEGQ